MTAAVHRQRAAVLGAITVLLASCDGGGGTETPRPASVVAVSITTQTAVVGTAVAQPPSVRVTDRGGQPVGGVAVTFAVAAGSGTLSSTAATTDARGVATAGTWTLGFTSVEQVVTATVDGLPPVQFVATGQPRTPTTVTAVSATTLTGTIDQPAEPQPTVRVLDQLGEPMARVGVVFAVTGGGGSILNANRTTDTVGIALAPDWTLGPMPGVNTLTATVVGLPAVTFTAHAYDPCTLAVVYTPLTSLAGSLRKGDCDLGSLYADVYFMTLPAARGISLRMGSTELDAWLEVYGADGGIIAFNDNGSAPPNAEVNLFAPAGDYFLLATSYYAYQTGSYGLSSEALTENAGCRDYWVVPGITLNGSLGTGDCVRSGHHDDKYLVVLRPGQQLSVRMEATAFHPALHLYDASSGVVLVTSDNGGAGTIVQLDYTATAWKVFGIIASGYHAVSTGGYSLTITSTGAERTSTLRPGQLPSGMLDAANDAARERAGDRKASSAARGPVSRVPFQAPARQVKRTGTR